MCDMVILGGKDNGLEPGNHISTLMFSSLDLLTSKLIGNIFLPWVVCMCDMVTLGDKDNCLQPGNRISTLMSSELDL
jgi:hypothetical protein